MDEGNAGRTVVGKPQRGEHGEERDADWRPRVLVLDDEWSSLESIKTFLSDEFEVTTASRSEAALEAMEDERFDVVLTDVRMPGQDGLSLVTELKNRYPDTQYILMTAFSDIEDTISALRLGVADYLRKPFTEGEVRHALKRCLEERRLMREVALLKAGKQRSLDDIVTKDPRMLELCRVAETVSSTDATVLISGDTGTGKGLLAYAIHAASPRRDRSFVTVDCASLPVNLIESELFGHERGSFTGAVARKLGKVEVAEGGTLLLDEIGELPLELQAKLLRFLQSFNFERVGGTKKLTANVRVIAATNRELARAVREGGFRQDLFYRLHVIHLHLPPLRERPADVLLLAENFLKRFAIKYGMPVNGFTRQAEEELLAHNWPGNVRELEHAVERAVILCRSARITHFDLAAGPLAALPRLEAPPPAPPAPGGQDLASYLADCERQYLRRLLSEHQGRIGDSARAAGVNPKTLYLKMERHGLNRSEFRPRRNGRGAAGGAASPATEPAI